MSSLRTRLDDLEEKLDACLILMQVATSHDDFSFTLEDTRRNYKAPERLVKQMNWARQTANQVALPEEKIHLASGQSARLVPQLATHRKSTKRTVDSHGTFPSEPCHPIRSRGPKK